MGRKPKTIAWRAFIAVAAISLSVGAGFGQAKSPFKSAADLPQTPVPTTIDAPQKEEVLNQINDIVEKTAFVPGVDFSKWPQFLSTERQDIDKATTPRLFATAVNKALHQFGFSHIVLVTPDAAQARLNKQSVGIGVLIQAEPDGMRVLNVFAGSPAAEGGLQTGDLIILGDGKKPETALDLLGDEGSTLTIKVKHANGKVEEYKLKRRKYSNVRPETLTWSNPETAVLKVNTFDLSYDKDRVETLMKQAAGAKNLIVDLRSNPGGSILNLVHLMGLLLPPGTPIGTFISRSSVDKYVKDEGGKATDLPAIARWSQSKLRAAKNDVPPFKGHIAVLVNGGSGSAAEIAAAALRDQAEAPIVGSKSAGAVLVSVMQRIPDGFMLQYPITDFVTVNGVRLEGTGVSPIIETPALVKFNEPDPAIEKATMLLGRAELRDERGATANHGNGQ
jgi:carboxyl-terminal processing protease